MPFAAPGSENDLGSILPFSETKNQAAPRADASATELKSMADIAESCDAPRPRPRSTSRSGTGVARSTQETSVVAKTVQEVTMSDDKLPARRTSPRARHRP